VTNVRDERSDSPRNPGTVDAGGDVSGLQVPSFAAVLLAVPRSVFVFLAAYLFLNERVIATQLIGGVLIVTAAASVRSGARGAIDRRR
jgi:hypothetical protein